MILYSKFFPAIHKLRHITQLGSKLYREMYKVEVEVDKVIKVNYEGWNFNSGNCLFTTDTK